MKERIPTPWAAIIRRRRVAPSNARGKRGDHRHDRLDAGVLHRFERAQHMAAGDMPGLVRDDADQHVRGLGPLDQAGVDEHRLPAGDKGIELLVVDEIDADLARVEPGDPPDRRRHRADVVFDLGVAQDLHATAAPGRAAAWPGEQQTRRDAGEDARTR
jgi:hypothetical protein